MLGGAVTYTVLKNRIELEKKNQSWKLINYKRMKKRKERIALGLIHGLELILCVH